MKFTCDKNTILHEILIAHDIISLKNTLSVLSNVLLIAENNTLSIKATDLKVSFESEIPIDVSTPGNTTVFCDKLLGILRSLPDGEIEFEQKDNKIFISPLFKKINFQLKSITSDQFPELQAVEEDKYYSIPQKDLVEMISQTIFAISDDETRFFMNGVYLENQDGKLIMVATDGRRLSYISKEIQTEIKQFSNVIIPAKILYLLKKLCSGEGNLLIAINDKNIFIKFDNLKLSSTLIDGQFPNYSRVIPEVLEHEIIVDKNDFNNALKRVSILVEEKSRRIYLSCENNVLTLLSEETEMGVAKEEISCNYEGENVTMALNYLYLLDPIKVITDEQINIRFSESGKAISIISVPERDYFHIVMPMQMD